MHDIIAHTEQAADLTSSHQFKLSLRSKTPLSGSQHIEDTEYADAVTSVEASTAAIDQQCRILEEQKKALLALKSNNAAKSESAAKTSRQSKLSRERAQLDFEIRELSDGLTARLAQSAKVANAATSKLQMGVTRSLERDDRLLEGLQKLTSKLPSRGEQTLGVGTIEVEDLCKCLTLFMTEDIKARVDEAYLSCAVEEQNHSEEDSEDDPERLATLRSELDDLSSEIDGLVSIVVEQQHRQPILDAITSSTKATEAEQERWSAYISDSLRYLSTKAEATDSYAQQLQAYNDTLRGISSTFREATTSPGSESGAGVVRPPSPEKPQKGLKPLRLLHRTSSSLQTADPVTRMLQNLSLPTPPSNATSDATALSEYLRTVADAPSDPQPTTEVLSRALAHHLSETTADKEALLDAAYLHSHHGKAKLADGELISAVEDLEVKTKGLGDEMRRSDYDRKLEEIREMTKKLMDESID